jgi:copper(I)-binding protein
MGHVEPDPRASRREVTRSPLRRAAAAATRTARACVGIAAVVATTAAGGAEIELVNAWVRPMLAGDKAIPAFVDIKTDAAVTLVGASSPVAKSVAIILEGDGSDTAPTATETTRFAVPAGTGRRLALNSDHLELRDVLETRLNGAKVLLQLAFVDAEGRRIVVETAATVRGLVPRSMLPPDAAD